jgi:predicted AAA+ superfamily ATPase
MATIDVIKQVIADQEQELKRLMSKHMIKRELGIKKNAIGYGVVGVITGIRRCGKSVLAQMFFSGDRYGYINFEDVRLSLKPEELNSVLEAMYSLKGRVNDIVLDEIQNIEGWEKFVGSLASSKRIIITGSNARLLSKELATYLVGRHMDFTLFPFSFREFLDYGSFIIDENAYTTESKAKIMKSLDEYIRMGGIPLAERLGTAYLAGLYSDILERDVIQRYRINNPSEFKHLSNYMMANFSREMTSNKLKNVVGIKTPNTISKWIGYLENAYVVFRIQRFSNKLKESIKAPKKIYALDTGMALTVYPGSINDRGRLIENLVAVELKRRIEYWHRDHSLYYWKNSNQEEVDFLLRKNNATEALIQVTYASSIEEVKERELKSLLKASEEQHCNNLNVITWDFSHTQTINGKSVRFVPLWIWLLDYKHVF